jgi:5-methyltetrahydropteroyltriglutamate--homocysteine methyltransferase
VLAGSDCGFATFSSFIPVDPKITWAKFGAMSAGARLASDRLWGR